MPFEQTITIINNSGKIISTGKHLVNIFKDAKAAYKEKKDALKTERAPVPGIQRAKTFDVSGRGLAAEHYYGYEYGPGDMDRSVYTRDPDRERYEENHGRRRSIDDVRSHASSRHSRRSHRHRSSSHHRPPLTESNLRTHSEVSSTTPSQRAYRSPYAETASRAMTLSRPTLAARTMTMPPPSSAARSDRARPPPASVMTETVTPVSTPRQSMLAHRPRSDSSLRKKPKEIDMNLAYGSIPPDLESRVDLDPNSQNSPELQEIQARSLLERVEGLLVEAQCVHHTATAIISHLQENPQAAAAVALTLAELSALLGKMSPAFLGIVKGGSPAVFALLASPQFLIGAGVAVGVTVVMFGGWKIVKRIRDANKIKEQAFEMQEPAGPEHVPNGPVPQPMPPPGAYGFAQGMAYGGGPGSFDEALVLEDELSTIETWRRGIAPFGDDETAEIELISPEAERTIIERHRGRDDDDIDPSDSVSHSGRSRAHRSSKSHRTHKSRRPSEKERGEPDFVPERKSSRASPKSRDDEHGRDRNRDDRSSRSGRSEGSHASSRHGSSSGSKRPERVALKAIEDGSKEAENTLEAVLQPKEKKNTSMLKSLFKKKKNKEDQAKERSEVSVSVR